MGRITMTNTNRRLPLTAAALFLLAGTAAAMAQAGATTGPKTASTVTQAQPATAGASAGNPNATGKLISHAGDKAQAKGGVDMRNPLESATPETGGDKVKVDEHLIVDLHVNDEDLANVLQMLSIQSQKNIVTSKNVSAVVTANLYGVTFFEALDAILHVNGYGYIERGNFIYVYTLEELGKIEEQQRHQVWKVLKLNYLTGTDAAEFVKPLLSEHGQIKTNGKVPGYTINEAAPTGDESFAQSSTLMVFDYEENLAEIEKVVKELDTRPAQVLVEATILQTTLNEANAFGVDFSIIGDLSFGDFVKLGGPLQAVDGLIRGTSSAASGSSGGTSGTGGTGSTGGASGTPLPSDGRGGAIVSSPGNTAGPATLKLGLVYNDVAAFLRILDEVSDTAILSRPNILTLNRQSARVLVGRKVGYLNTTSTSTTSTQTVEFLDTGTQLYFRPFVSADGMVRMELKPKVSEAVIRNVTNSGGAAVTIPDEISNELTTNVMCKDGQTIVLGGLFRENTQTSRRQVPGLGDMPVIGAAFRGHEDATQRSEIIFMITPTIMNDAVMMEQADRGTQMQDRVRTGTREQLLPWSREKRTQQLVVQATELMQQGKHDQALYKVQRALEMNHMQPDAIALREALMNKKTSWPTRSTQHEIITGEMAKQIKAAPKNAFVPDRDVKAADRAAAKAAKTPKTVPTTTVAVEQAGQIFEQERTPDPSLTFTNTQPEPATPVQSPVAKPAEPAVEPMPEPSVDPANTDPKDIPSAALPPVDPAGDPNMDPATEPGPAAFEPANPAMAQDPSFDPNAANADPANMDPEPLPFNADPASTNPNEPVPLYPAPAAAREPLPGPLPAGSTVSARSGGSQSRKPSANTKSAYAFSSVWGMMRAFRISNNRGSANGEFGASSGGDNK